jgi:hypothetical protein
MSVKEKAPQDHKEKAVKGSQVKTVVLLEQQRIVVACPKCKEIQLNVGSNFCSNCGEPLKWDNIEIVKPPKPEPKSKEPTVEVDKKTVN